MLLMYLFHMKPSPYFVANAIPIIVAINSKMASASRKIVSEGKLITEVPHIVNREGHHLFCKYWEPNAAPVALVFLIHGYGAYCARFEQFAKKLNEIGAYVFSHDHIGHGDSEGDGWFIEDFRTLTRDILDHIKIVQDKYPSLPLFLFGHSMGGSLAVCIAAENPDMFKGVIVSGGSMVLDSNTASPFQLFLLRNITKILPRMKLMKLTADDLTRDKEDLEFCKTDPMQVQHGLICRTAQSLIDLSLYSQTVMEQVVSPLLILHGGVDRVTCVDGSKMLHEKSKSTDKTLKIFPELYHNLLHELMEDRMIVMQTINDWIKDRYI